MTIYALPEAPRHADPYDGGRAAVEELCRSVFAKPYLRMPQLAALRAHDEARGSGYVATLATCLDSLGNAAASAERLGVHVNTFRYRLRRLAEVGGIDLDDPDTRLVLGLELAAPPPDPWPPSSGEAPVAVVALRVLGGDDDAPCRLARMVALSWDALRTSAGCDVAGHVVYSVVSLGSASSAAVVTATVRRAVREAENALSLPVLAGIGPAVAGTCEVEVSRRLADDVLRALASRGGERVATLEDVRTEVVLRAFAAAASEWPDLDGGAVARLAAHDAAHGTRYVATLRTYLECFGDVGEAATRAYVHVRTFRYRLRRIEALSGLCLRDPAWRLAAHLELRVRPR
ncbi:MAG TPA: helix-turn-helix domain-containing protein [Frankiaceae bacterium]|jgi:DNA-binding PucR family transcriptional regulator|nr:helix-turn-helix domain-containing protein [Frankiaceae bacterium]